MCEWELTIDVSEWIPVNVGSIESGLRDVSMVVNVNMISISANAWVLGNGMQLLNENGNTFEINLLLFANDTGLVADSEDSEEKSCRPVRVCGRVCERRKLRENVYKSIVNGDRMYVRETNTRTVRGSGLF